MNSTRLLLGFMIGTVAALIGTGAAWLMHSPPHEVPVLQSLPTTVERSGTIDANPFGKGEYSLPVTPNVQDLAHGTGVFRINAKGDLVLDYDTKVRLDILIADLPQNATRYETQAVEASAVAGLPQHAVQKALGVVDGYVRYLKAEAQLNQGFANGSAVQPEEMLNQVVALRRQHLGAQVADAFFSTQEAQDRIGIQIALMDADPKLTAQEKLARLDALQRTLPDNAPALRAELDTSRSALTMEQGVTSLRQQGATEAQILQLRERHVGAEAAQEISDMEVQKIDWERRQQTFSQQKNAITQMSISEQQKQERIEALLSQTYSEEEIPVARAYHQLQVLR
jgi:lipase chaperone LimK